LSYAALYTHAKTKHEGQFPEGTTTLHKKKQGRPKKYDPSVDKGQESARKANFNDDLQAFLQICPKSQRAEDDDKEIDFVKEFPIEFFKDQTLFTKILTELTSLSQELPKQDGESYSEKIDNLIYYYSNTGTTCNKVLC